MSLSGRGLKSILQKNLTDVVILSSLRTPITRAKKGAFKDAYPEELLSAVLKATLAANPNLDPAKIDDVAVGYMLAFIQQPASAQSTDNVAQDWPPLQWWQTARNYGSRAIPTVLWPELRDSDNGDARACIMPMGITSENVAERYGISRNDQDAFAANSHVNASKAQKDGLFDDEIVPVTTTWLDPDAPEQPGKVIKVDRDDGIRQNASLEGMRKLKPAFKEDGSSTAGNSSQISDGAAATLLIRRSVAIELGLSSSILGKWVATQTIGCHPDEMGVGPAVAIPRLLDVTGLQTKEVGIWEINEAFASQALYCIRKLGIPEEKVNPKGGAIALGHPLGATGARQLATLLSELARQGQDVGIVSMCVGTGMGMASMFVRE
ncbi:hypothetical protein EPUS_09139 [Endocarpon pusillum Z07020]|uniref:acetyl-CoA C-acyltransferase n=1 Tax=Endocarpon pusillum (strain Z07020 / HMAS-L-300199) TaxID=1263415 RepID=U1GAF7_ENDPU|nr:uncharacterized protein EPUS_09139 [Endocarpon pusillum Z07020]ERF68646.1 hypothetical protein EPUS_09139 [Endocarpon pusillum Z07020]